MEIDISPFQARWKTISRNEKIDMAISILIRLVYISTKPVQIIHNIDLHASQSQLEQNSLVSVENKLRSSDLDVS